MNDFLLRPGRFAFRRVKTGSGDAATNGGVIQIELEKVWLIDEHTIRVVVAQAFAGAPTSYDVRRFFKSIALVVDKGDGHKMNFHAAYDLGRLIENAPAPIVSLGVASTAEFIFDLHHAMDGAVGELCTALLSGKYSSLSLELTVNPDANNGFIGGTTPAAASYALEVMPKELRDQTPEQRNSQAEGWGHAEVRTKMLKNMTGDVNGKDIELGLVAGGKVRFIMLHAFDAASYGNLTNAVFQNGARVTFASNGFQHYENTALSVIQQKNTVQRIDLGTGVCVLDFGDDPKQWPDLRDVKEPKIDIAIPASTSLPAAWRIEACQLDAVGLEKLNGALKS